MAGKWVLVVVLVGSGILITLSTLRQLTTEETAQYCLRAFRSTQAQVETLLGQKQQCDTNRSSLEAEVSRLRAEVYNLQHK